MAINYFNEQQSSEDGLSAEKLRDSKTGNIVRKVSKSYLANDDKNCFQRDMI